MDYLILSTNPDGQQVATFTDKVDSVAPGAVVYRLKRTDLDAKFSEMKVSGTPGNETDTTTAATTAAPAIQNPEETKKVLKRTIEHISQLMDNVDAELREEVMAEMQAAERRMAECAKKLANQRALRRLEKIRPVLADSTSMVLIFADSFSAPYRLTGISDDNTTVTVLQADGPTTYPKTLAGTEAWVQNKWVTVGRKHESYDTDVVLGMAYTVPVLKDGKFYHVKMEQSRIAMKELKPVTMSVETFARYGAYSVAKPNQPSRPLVNLNK